MMLEFLGEADAAARIRKACADTADDAPARPREIGDAIAAAASLHDERHRRCPSHPTEKIWMNGELVDWDDAQIHVLTHTLHYGTGVFEGIRAYETVAGPGGVPPHRAHRAAVPTRAQIMMMEIPYTVDELVEATKETVRLDRAAGVLHPADRVLRLRRDGAQHAAVHGRRAIACWPWGAVPRRRRASTKGVRMKISSWTRHDHNTMPPASKTTGNYVNSSLAKVEALKAGYDEAIMLTPQRPRGRVHRREHLRRPQRHASSRRRCRPARSRASPRTR